MSTQNESSNDDIPVTSITIYGGKADAVGTDAKSILGIVDNEYYGTWLSMGIMQRLGFLFEGGVESAGGLAEILCMFAVLIMVLAVFAFWSVAVVFIVILVLTILSGGAGYKFLRAVYITAPLSKLETTKVDEFVIDQVRKGRFVRVEGIGEAEKMAESTHKSSTALSYFRRGIQFALFIATIFLISEVVYYLMNQHWLSGLNAATATFEITVLIIFGLLFLIGIVVMDIGVLLRRDLSKKVE
jgi:hypothetical protein